MVTDDITVCEAYTLVQQIHIGSLTYTQCGRCVPYARSRRAKERGQVKSSQVKSQIIYFDNTKNLFAWVRHKDVYYARVDSEGQKKLAPPAPYPARGSNPD